MIVSIPVPTTGHTCSELPDARTLDELIEDYGDTHTITKGMKIRTYAGGNVYEYSISKNIYVVPFNPTGLHSHAKGDIVVKNGSHHLIVKRNYVAAGASTPARKWAKQPEEYANLETDLSKIDTWTGRYFRYPTAPAGRHINSTANGKTYTLFWSTKNNCNGHFWKVRDNIGYCGCHSTSEQCIQKNHSRSFTAAKDIRAIVKNWGTTCGQSLSTIFMRSMVERGNYMYFRTHKKVAVEYHTTAAIPGTAATINYETRRIYSPKEIDGFRYEGKTNCFAAFDNKNYTKGIFEPARHFVDLGFVVSDPIDTIAIGRVYAESVTVTARDESNKVIFEVRNYPIHNDIADTDIGQDSNVIIYSDVVLPPNTEVEIRLRSSWVSVGRILAGRKMNLGFSNTKFTNGFKDFSPREQDQWGNIEYRNGIRVYLYSGTVDLPLKDYDALNRAFMHIGGREMIINGSDTYENTPPDSIEVFQSTMFIGRFTSFKPSTKNIGGIMDTIANYSFSCEEST